MLGREINKLVDNFMSIGKHSVNFDGSKFSSGIYYYRIVIIPYDGSEKIEKHRKMQILK
jgi:hypothetical protein